jgi:hypothetical protein
MTNPFWRPPHPERTSYAGRFVGTYSHRTILGGTGHNPQAAPEALPDVVLTVGG